ncbi:hypothetical protein [Pedobacter sp. Leaf250]|uniref:hypothetical protein n=1 Tax=Pedobacter sp. Leaf250 TaxID=2876559 RepID=UPI001E555F1D|nr:hypothetical protein [Pedobacter sp. Leaf250]
MAIIFKPYNVLAFAAISYLISTVFVNHTIDINIADTYFFVNYAFIVAFICGFLITFAALYKFLNKYFSIKLLTWLHISLLIILPSIAVWISDAFHKSLALIETTDAETMDYILSHHKKLNIIFIIFIFIQILPVINFLISSIKKKYPSAKV